MRKQTRPAAPDEFRQNADKWNLRWCELRAKNPSAKFQWYETGGHSARDIALPRLKEMTQDHCAFCDAFPLDDRSSEPVEHFKPKSRTEFCMEAYSWNNLFYCCDFCQKSKHEQWDERLLRPDSNDYAFTRYFRFVYSTGEIEPNPVLKDCDPEDWEKARVTIDAYGLDQPAKRRRRMEALRDWTDSNTQVLDHRPYRDYLEGVPLLSAAVSGAR